MSLPTGVALAGVYILMSLSYCLGFNIRTGMILSTSLRNRTGISFKRHRTSHYSG